ncbi:hypothetical protein F7C95_14955 [Opitutia bacterium ISCC 51]|nr:hypothetical protein F7C95_14955 [Opitutae bacterium ISCC 51]QXD27285.1 hypothetical protein GA003_14860 [Opitutae bacterium ISCC 52]
MKALLPLTLITLLSTLVSYAETKVPSVYWQITTAVLAAQESDRENATVMGYRSDGTLAVLREGSNDLICLADDPKKKNFSVACYHKSLEPFMARARALRKEGKSEKEIFDIREEEIKAGKLEMPERALLAILTGKVNEETQEIENKFLRWVFYIPFATPESTGLPLAPQIPGGPWIMNPGTHRAHIMITPPKN